MEKIYSHLTVENENSKCYPVSFPKEEMMEDYLNCNRNILSFNNCGNPILVKNQLDWIKKSGKGRLDLLLTYPEDYYAIAELKNSPLSEKDFNQLNSYFELLHEKVKSDNLVALLKKVTNPKKWFGLLIGIGIDLDLQTKLSNGTLKLQNGKYDFGVLILNRHIIRHNDDNINIVIVNVLKQPKLNKRDYTKYILSGKEYSKNKLVFTLIELLKEKGLTGEEIKKSFIEIDKSYKKVLLLEEEAEKFKSWRFDNLLEFKDGSYSLASCWSKDEIDNVIIPLASKYKIEIKAKK